MIHTTAHTTATTTHLRSPAVFLHDTQDPQLKLLGNLLSGDDSTIKDAALGLSWCEQLVAHILFCNPLVKLFDLEDTLKVSGARQRATMHGQSYDSVPRGRWCDKHSYNSVAVYVRKGTIV